MNGESGSREAPALFLCLRVLPSLPPLQGVLRIPELGSMLFKNVRLCIKILTALSKHCQNIVKTLSKHFAHKCLKSPKIGVFEQFVQYNQL